MERNGSKDYGRLCALNVTLKDGKEPFDNNTKLEVLSKKGRGRAVGLKSCTSFGISYSTREFVSRFGLAAPGMNITQIL